MLADFDESFLANAGFTSEELDEIFQAEEHHEVFDLQAELKKLDIASVDIKPGDIFELDGSRAMCGDSTVEADVLKLMNGEKADLCLTDPPYILSYNSGGKRHGKTTQGFGYKKDRTYLGTETLPENFSELWMDAIAKVQKPDFSIIVFENPKISAPSGMRWSAIGSIVIPSPGTFRTAYRGSRPAINFSTKRISLLSARAGTSR